MKSSIKIFTAGLIIFLQSCSNKEPYKLPVYHAEGFVIGEENCSIDSNYNYYLLDLSINNNSSEKGDSIIYDSIKYYHAFKTLTTDYTLHKPGNKVEFDFNFLDNNHIKTQPTSCDVPNAKTFSLIDIHLLNVKEVN